MTQPDPDPVDLVAEALGRLRGRGPRSGGPHGGAPGRALDDARAHAPWAHPHREHGAEHPHHDPRGGLFDGPRGAGPARMRMLGALMVAAGPLSVSDLADAVGVDQPRASRLVQQGVQLGLVERQTDLDDARRTRIALTEQGRAVAAGIRAQRREAIRHALDALTADEQREFARLFSIFSAAWPQR